MARRIPNATLEAEVHTWTDQVSSGALLDALKAVYRRPVIDRTFDIPYIAGYSRDGRTVFIDRHMPKAMWIGKRLVRTDRFIVLHEVVEKALLDEVRLHYLHAHQLALRAEEAAVHAAEVGWRDYDRFVKANEKHIEDERLTRVPPTLDLTPYRDEEDFPTLRAMVRARHPRDK